MVEVVREVVLLARIASIILFGKDFSFVASLVYLGFLNTRITESPLRNILEMNLSLFTGAAFFAPFPVFGTSVQISLTFSSTMLQCRSKALTRANSLRLLRQLISTCELVFTLCVSTDRGPVANSSPSLFSACVQRPMRRDEEFWGRGEEGQRREGERFKER